MRSRRKARESCLQALYQLDALENWSFTNLSMYSEHCLAPVNEEDPLESDNFEFFKALAAGVLENRDFIDKTINSACTNWVVSRMPLVDRNLLRLAVYELAFILDIPVSVSINEAVEIAKRYGGEDTPGFVNGVLDRVGRMLEQNPRVPNVKKAIRTATSSSIKRAVNQ